MRIQVNVALAVCATLLATPAVAQLSGLGDPEAMPPAATSIDPTNTDERDPWEGFNRKMFAVNNTFDRNLIVPAAKAYRAVTHKKQRKGIRNFFANLRTPVIFVNDLLQGEIGRAGETLGRFAINSTIGFGGMGDPAERLGIPQHSEDFGQTLAVWGIDSGPYLVLPFLGPTTVRDGFGSAIAITANPTFWIDTTAADYYQYTTAGVGLLSVREPLIEPLAEIEANSLDYYASIRSFYLQSRTREINNGQTDFEDLPDIGDFDDIE